MRVMFSIAWCINLDRIPEKPRHLFIIIDTFYKNIYY